ncbi:MAG TPA: YadA-like family protein [Bradyrhizobium sp.]|nr:YadA-like family protein [Bradyrhizobium sp.]
MKFSQKVPAGLATLAVALCLGTAPVKAQFVCAGNTETTATGDGASALGSPDNFACGTNANATGNGSTNTAIGINSDAHGDASRNTANGNRANASGTNSFNTATGRNADASGASSANTASGVFAVAHGDASVNTASGFAANASGAGSQNIAIGANADARGDGTNNVAIGTAATATGANSSALGTGAQATFDNSTAIGNGATATRANQQMFGTASNTYTMAGIATAASRAAQVGPTSIVTSDNAGNLATRSLADLGFASQSDISGINGRLDALNGRINDVNREARGGIALALAASGLQFDTRPGKVSLSGGYGNFKGQSGFAVGLGYAVSESMRFNAAFTAAQQGDIGARVGASWTLN